MEPLIIKISIALVWAVIVGLLAKRKNRNPLAWGAAGALSWLIALIILAFMPYKCPKCGQAVSNKEWKKGVCSSCGNLKETEVNLVDQSLSNNNNKSLKNISLPFKDNLSAFEYSCKYLDTTLGEKALLPAIVVDAKEEFGTMEAVKVEDDGSQLAMIRVASSDGGFIVPAKTTENVRRKLKPGDFIAWQAIQYIEEIAKVAEDARFGWAGLIIGTLKPVYKNNGWDIDK